MVLSTFKVSKDVTRLAKAVLLTILNLSCLLWKGFNGDVDPSKSEVLYIGYLVSVVDPLAAFGMNSIVLTTFQGHCSYFGATQSFLNLINVEPT